MFHPHVPHTSHSFFTHPTPTHFTIFTSIPTSTNSNKINHLPHFSLIKNHHKPTKKSPQPLKYQVFYRSKPKNLTYSIKTTPQNTFNPISQFLKTPVNQYFSITQNSQNRTCSVEVIISHQTCIKKFQLYPHPVILHPIINNTTHHISYWQSLE